MSNKSFESSRPLMDSRLVALYEAFPPVKGRDKNDHRPPAVFLKETEPLLRQIFKSVLGDVPGTPEGIPRNIVGMDGNKIDIKIYYPARSSPGNLPGLVYYHGGGMGQLRMSDYDSLYRYLASYGIVVIGVDFRNSPEAPFPAGLHDCFSALLWTADHAHELRIDSHKLIVGGESGGGNLAAATCLLAAEKKISIIKGQFLVCPYLTYDTQTPSRVKYAGQFSSAEMVDIFAQAYTPPTATPSNTKNPLAWPYYAPAERLRGLPPALVIVNELDILADEGEEYALRLSKAGVPVVSMRSNATVHAASLALHLLPDVAAALAGALSGWVQSLSTLKKSKL